MTAHPPRQATLHRMVMPTHICPYGLKAKHLLESRGYTVDDRWLTTRAETDAFKAEHGMRAGEWFISISMCVLALLKLQYVERFATMFLNYDLLARRWVPYSYAYPFAEGAAGVLMTAGVLTWLSAPIALVIGGIGAVSVFKAVYIDKREIKCACVGGSSKVPLGFVSLVENLMMVAMAIWMLVK
ncbi:MauE/DoxX family redox-associated membrane protein [Sphingomonas montanisoli]|uniref:Methylamine utilization protein MauE n=1 Tax=Sphingomonas montanisoli TaxID=2606412 RepID=A0A5D9CDZ2_9SPHN|nr:MauE/DoxX family redox-associated membrane protein [Sphingomonas montanisoli]TZG29576.1 glutaredoxin [Sphingomonas montanisoli]